MSIPTDTDGPGVDPCTEVIPPDMVLTIDVNYQVITLILKKYGNLPLCLENYVLFSLPPIFTNYLYTYTLSYIIYLGEQSGNTISNYHGTFIHIFMHGYYPILNIYIRPFFWSMLPFYLTMYLLSFQCYF